jgi:hypothetical protein
MHTNVCVVFLFLVLCLLQRCFMESMLVTCVLVASVRKWLYNVCISDERTQIRELGLRSRYSDWLRVGRPSGWSSSPGGGKIFHFSMSSRLALDPTQPPIQRVPGTLSPGVKRLRREVDHSPPTSAEVKKKWIYTSTPPYAFMVWCLIS